MDSKMEWSKQERNMKKTLISLCSVGLLVVSGCSSTGNINPSNLAAALSQDNASDSFTGATPYGNIQFSRSVGNTSNTTPVVPLTSVQLAAVTNDPIANIVYQFSKDPASVNFSWTGVGGTYIFHRAMPPNTLSTNL
jgi:hypothetical protein